MELPTLRILLANTKHMKLRNKVGQFRKSRKYWITGILLFMAVVMFLSYGGTTEVFIEKVDARDNIQKVTDDLADKMRIEKELKQQLLRAQVLYLELEEMHDTAVDDVDDAEENISLYRGN